MTRQKPVNSGPPTPLGYAHLTEKATPQNTEIPFGEPIRRRGRLTRVALLPVHLLKLILTAAIIGVLFAGMLAPFVLVPGLTAKKLADNWHALPTELPVDQALPERVTMTDRYGNKIATFYAEDRINLTLDQISPHVVDALLATEDARFYEHSGVDPKGIARALVNNSSGNSTQGASTITQQYVKNILMYAAANDEERQQVTGGTLDRKIREARYAVALENTLTKDQILEGYLNTVYFGDGAYGIGAAARHYFGVAAADLTIPQAATLVGILKSTTHYDPTNDIDASERRRNFVIGRMVATEKISQAEGEKAQAEPMILNVRERLNGCVYSTYPMYCQWVKESLLSDPIYGATPEDRQAFFEKGGFTIRTALDPAIQDEATKQAVKALGARNRVAAGIVVMEPGTGQVVALATNKPWGSDTKRGQTELILPALPAYQPGSNFKPVVLATALEQGIPATTRFDTPNNYIPKDMNHPKDGFSNDDDSGHGVIDAYRATADSVNTYFVQLIERTGVKPVADLARRIGITSLPTKGPLKITNKDASLALGAYETSPLQMATAYATFAAHGVTCNPVNILSIVDRNNTSLPVNEGNCRQSISPAIADTVTDVLQEPFNGGTASQLKLEGDRPAAGKTGTTNDSAATWFTGYTPQYVTSIWIGDPRGGQRYPLKNVRAFGTTYPVVYGSYIAGPIWKNIMNWLHKDLDVQEFAKPGTITQARPIVPNVIGLTLPAAAQILTDNGFKIKIAPEAGTADGLTKPGQIYEQSPEGGSQYGAGSEITLTLSNGSDTNIVIK